MYTMQEITLFEDIPTEEFDSLFSSSLPYMELGTYSWNFIDNPTTNEEKKEALKNRFIEMFENNSNQKCVICRKNGVAIQLFLGAINSNDSDYVTWTVALYGPDGNGSKSWLYDLDYIQACKDHFVNTYGVKGYKISCMNTGSLKNYHLNKPSANTFYDIELDKIYTTTKGDELALISYTYK